MSRTTISIDKSLAEMVRERALQDNMSVSSAFTLLAKGYTENRIKIWAHMSHEPEIEALTTTPQIQAKMDHLASLL